MSARRGGRGSGVDCSIAGGDKDSSFGSDSMAKIGTKRHPAIVRVETADRANEIMDLCEQHGIQVMVGIEPDKQGDISDVERLLRRVARAKPSAPSPRARVGPNDYCPCGSGRYKKCCGGSVG
jgi:SWIM/SEC-C metal-binding protein